VRIPLRLILEARDYVPARYADPRYTYLRITHAQGRVTLEAGTREERVRFYHTPENPPDHPFDLGVPRVLFELAENLTEDPDLFPENNTLYLEAGKFRGSLKTFSFGETPQEEVPPPAQGETTVEAQTLREALGVLEFAKEESYPPPLNAVWFTEEGLVGSDGYTLAFYPLKAGFGNFALPRRYTANLLKLLKESSGPVSLRWGSRLTVETPEWQYTASLARTSIPNWRTVIPTERPNIPLPRRELLRALRGLTALEAEVLHMHLKPDGFTLYASGVHGSGETTIPAQLPHEALYMVNLEALKRALDFLTDPTHFTFYPHPRATILVLQDPHALIAQTTFT